MQICNSSHHSLQDSALFSIESNFHQKLFSCCCGVVYVHVAVPLGIPLLTSSKTLQITFLEGKTFEWIIAHRRDS